MINYLEHKVSNEEVKKIFNNNINRDIFIWDYPFFGLDTNEWFYTEFIENNIAGSKWKAQEDAIELSIATHNFKETYLEVITKIIYSRRNEWIKLLCLDWLFCFYQSIPNETFIVINEYSRKKSKNQLLKIQSVLNMLLVKKRDNQLFKDLFKSLKERSDPAVFYRVLNSLKAGIKLTGKMTLEIINEIDKNKTVSIAQKTELKEKINKILRLRVMD